MVSIQFRFPKNCVDTVGAEKTEFFQSELQLLELQELLELPSLSSTDFSGTFEDFRIIPFLFMPSWNF